MENLKYLLQILISFNIYMYQFPIEDIIIETDYAKLMITHFNYFILIMISLYSNEIDPEVSRLIISHTNVYNQLIDYINEKLDSVIFDIKKAHHGDIPTCYLYDKENHEEEANTDQYIFDGDEKDDDKILTDASINIVMKDTDTVGGVGPVRANDSNLLRF